MSKQYCINLALIHHQYKLERAYIAEAYNTV